LKSVHSDKTLVGKLKRAGLRVTPQRLAIYRTLVSTDIHPSAQTLFERLQSSLPSLSQATVYNTLQTLASHGLIQRMGEVGDGAVRYDGNPAPHVNLICTVCHKVTDEYEISLADITEQAITCSGFEAQDVRVTLYGLCTHCRK
jgi:Fur family peroxide stress response transcriptional regulator